VRTEPRASPRSRVEGEDQRRSAVARDDAGRGDADDAVQPALAADDERVAPLAARVGGEQREGLADDEVLALAPVAVEALDALGHRPGLGDGAGAQQAERGLGGAEAAGGVEARAEAKAEVALVDGLVGADAGVLEQGADAGAAALADDGEAVADEDAVLGDQRDHVADGAEGDEVEPLARVGQRGGGLAAERAAQRGAQVEGDTGATKALEREVAAELMRVQERGRGRHLLGDLMVIDDDRRDPADLEPLERLVIRGAAVAGQHQAHAGLAQHLGLGLREAVAALTGGHAGDDLDADRLEVGGQDRRGGDAVDVVVPEHADPPALAPGGAQQLDRGLEAGHARGRAQVGEARPQELLLLRELDDAAAEEDPHRRLADIEPGRVLADALAVDPAQRTTHAEPRRRGVTGLAGHLEALGLPGHGLGPRRAPGQHRRRPTRRRARLLVAAPGQRGPPPGRGCMRAERGTWTHEGRCRRRRRLAFCSPPSPPSSSPPASPVCAAFLAAASARMSPTR
jgi:hypothetical protein